MTATTGPDAIPSVRSERSEWAQTRDFIRGDGAPLVLLLALAIGLAAGIGLVVVHGLDATAFGRFDVRAERWLAAHRTGAMNTFTGWVTQPAESIPVAALTVLTIAVAWFSTRRWQAPVFVAIAVGGEKLTYLVTSLIVDRDRPPVPTIGHVYAAGSFPSGHVGSAVSLYGAIALLMVWSGRVRGPSLQAVLAVAVALVTALVAYARMYRGDHFPTDVTAGALVGLTWLLVARHRVLVRHPLGGPAPEAPERPGDAARRRRNRRLTLGDSPSGR